MEQRHSSTSTPTSSVIPPPSQSALSLLTSIQQSPRSSSGCPSLDALLTPTSIKNKLGLAQGNVLELLGPPGIGKSRTALGFLLDQRFASLEGSNGAGRQVLLVGKFSMQYYIQKSKLTKTFDRCRRIYIAKYD